jgi:hypothetical protein
MAYGLERSAPLGLRDGIRCELGIDAGGPEEEKLADRAVAHTVSTTFV